MHVSWVFAFIAASESLTKLSKMYRVSVPQLIDWNAIKNVKDLYPGQLLVVKRDGGTEAQVSTEEAHPMYGKLSLEKSDFVKKRR